LQNVQPGEDRELKVVAVGVAKKHCRTHPVRIGLMATVYRGEGLRIVIFLDDHEPAHVHVFGDGHAKFNLSGPHGEPELVWSIGMNRGEARKAFRLVREQQLALLRDWERIHGST